jgi:RNA polymerase sigma-70 factor (ECF subfamily)
VTSAGDAQETGDAELLAAHVAGDPDAFGTLFTRHRDRLWAVALRTTGNPEEAADALQDALVSAFRRAETFRGDSAVTTWLHRIVVNACLDRLRRRQVRAADPLPDDLEEHATRGTLLTRPDPDGDPEARAVASDRARRVLAALEALPPEQRAALVLVDMEGWPVQEASAVLGVPTGTVKSRCSRGRARLATLLADLEPVRPGPAPGGAPAATPQGTRGRPVASQSSGPPGDPPGPPPGQPAHPAGPIRPAKEVSGRD